MPQNFTYSDAGLALTKQFEGLELNAYQDSVGKWTIGYGHTASVTPGQTITEEQAEELLRADVASAEACVNQAVSAAIQQNHFDALVDFCFNLGNHALTSSTLLRDLNQELFDQAADQFGVWVHAGTAILPGLVKRRAAEAAMFRGQAAPEATGN